MSTETASLTATPLHTVVVTQAGGHRRYAVECPGLTDWCVSWEVCPACERKPDDDDELEQTGEAHGARHRRTSEGWSVMSGECFYATGDYTSDAVQDLDLTEPGRYPVRCAVEDEFYPVFRLAGEADAMKATREGATNG